MGYKSIDEYIASFPKNTKKKLQEMRKLINQEAPDAIEKISYQMPTFFLKKNLVHFAAYAKHIGFYPTPSGIITFQKELIRYKSTKGSVQFPIDEPLPRELIKKIVQFRVKENIYLTTKQKNMSIKVLDDTLRDGEQQVGVNFSISDKEKLIKSISKIGLFGITVMPIISELEKKLMKSLLKKGYNEKLYAATMLDQKYIDEMIQLGFKKIILFSSISDILLKTKGLSREENLRKAIDCCSYAKKKGLDVIFAGEDSTRADEGYLLNFIKSIEKYIINFLVCDTVGILDEKKTQKLINLLKKEVDCGIGVHFHNDRGLANKNAIVAIKSGAELLSGTFGGIGERAGNSDIVDVLLKLKEEENLSIDGIAYKDLQALKDEVTKLGGSEPAKPYSKEAFYHESGIHVSALLKNNLSYNSFPPEKFGFKNTYFFGKYAGIANYKYLFNNKYNNEELIKIRDYFKELSYKEKKSFTEKEVRKIIKSTSLGNSSSKIDHLTGAYFNEDTKLNCVRQMFSIERLGGFFRALDNLFDTNDGKKAINALDFGAGNGFIGENINKYLQKKGHKVRMNYNDLNIDFLKSKENVYNLDNKNLFQIETSSIDLIVGGSVLHYEENTDLQIKVLKELHRILKDDGKILYQGFVCNSLLEKDFFSFVGGLAGRKQMLHTQEEWINIFIKGGFSIMKINHNDFIWRQTDVDYFGRFFKNTDSNKKKKITDKIINKIKGIKDISNQIKYKGNTFERNIRYDLFLLGKS